MSIRAKVTLQVTVDSGSHWPPEVTAAQVYDQAVQGALMKVRRVLKQEAGVQPSDVQLVSVEAVLVDLEAAK